MSTLSVEQINDAVKLNTLQTPAFKTLGLSVDLLLPLEEATAAQRGILPALATRATRRYPDYTALSCRLAELYGASLRSGVRKFGEYQVLELSVSGIASRYAFGGEDMLAELSPAPVRRPLRPPAGRGGGIPPGGLPAGEAPAPGAEGRRVQRQDGLRPPPLRGASVPGPAGGHRPLWQPGGRPESPPGGLYQAWRQTLETARIEIFALGDCQPEASAFRQRFQGIGQPRLLGKAPYREPQEVLRVTEEQPVSQGKLSLAYRVDAAPQERMLFQLVNAVLGGTVSSKLFLNVREKMSLCYYCSSAFSWASGALFIDSGVEPDNMDRAEEAIQAQLDAICQGDVTERNSPTPSWP